MSLHERLAELSALGAGGDGIDRALFTPAEHAARRSFARWAMDGGCTVEQDRAGNVFARLAGSENRPPVQCGSHLDTVKGGGAYDGAYGVIGGLAALERIAASGAKHRHPLEVVAWAGEEGSRFPLGCLGSSAFAGVTPLTEIEALVGDDGEPFGRARLGPSGLLPHIAVRPTFPPPAAYVELHIEQGPVLERHGVRLGVVTAIAGQRRFAVTIGGQTGHAGTVPMNGRADALCAAAELVLAVEQAALDVGEAVATVGRLAVEPNQTNIVPGNVTLRVDARSVDDERIAEIERRIRAAGMAIAQRRATPVTVELLERRAAAPMDARLRALVRTVCERLDPGCIDVPSGAGHDAMCLAAVVPAAMIFVPSIGGHSHVALERTEPADLDLGVDALAATLLAVERELAS